MRIDINCDLGEGFGSYSIGNDSLLMNYITSANIACGFHAGDFMTIRKTAILCIASGVSIGAHPGYPDQQGFGRRSIEYTPEEIYAMILYQVGALKSITESEGGIVRHVKPHGAMYHDTSSSVPKARAVAEAVRKAGKDIILLCPSGSVMHEAAAESGVPYAIEAFADRQYNSRGQLVPRSVPDSVITIPAVCAARVVTMVSEKKILSIDGCFIPVNPDSICVHGDTPAAMDIAMAIRKALEDIGTQIKPFEGRKSK